MQKRGNSSVAADEDMDQSTTLHSPDHSPRWLQLLFFAGVVVAVVPLGSASASTMAFAAMFHGTVAILALLTTSLSGRIVQLAHAVVWVGVMLVAWAFLQSLELANHPFADPAWNALAKAYDFKLSAISLNPGATQESLPQLASPFAIFISGLLLFKSDDDAIGLLRFLAAFGLMVGIFALMQFLLSPKSLLIFEKRFYLDSLSAPFVNRNAAGTFLGLATTLWLGLSVGLWHRLNPAKLVDRLVELRLTPPDKYSAFMCCVAATVVLLVALYLTRSRGAALATLLATTTILILMNRSTISKFKQISFALAVPLFLFVMLGGGAFERLLLNGDESRLCVYASTLRAIEDHPILGTGLGTFLDVFPLYRDIDCVGISSIWSHAHNTWLEAALALGLPGCVIILIGLFLLVKAQLKGLRNRNHQRWVPALGCGILILAGGHAVVDFSLQTHGVCAYLVCILSACTTISLAETN
jgi:O-antigen ligase